MFRARALAVAVLIVFYGAVGARQPAVRGAVQLPVPAATIAAAADLPSPEPATLLLHLTRAVYDEPTGKNAGADKRRDAVRNALWAQQVEPGEPVPLPLDPSIWRDTILQQATEDRHLVATIFADRPAALLYYGLSAFDDETLGWLGPDRETLLHLRAHPGVFAAFGRSIRVRGSRIAVPGGDEAKALWTTIVEAEPEQPGAFVQRLVRDDGRLAYFYDTLAHLDGPRQRFALGMQLPTQHRSRRFQALYSVFAASAPEWRVADRPFSRPQLDGAVMLAAVRVDDDGNLGGPAGRRLWDSVFRADDGIDVPYSEVDARDIPRDDTPVDAAWLASRIARAPYAVGRRRLDTFLFAQRVFSDVPAADASALATALRGVSAFPALMLSLERIGIVDPATFVAAARTAESINQAGSERHTSMMAFQATVGLIERARRSASIDAKAARALTRQLCELDVKEPGGYGPRIGRWVQTDFARALPEVAPSDPTSPVEDVLLSALAGVTANRRHALLEWEGQRYLVDPAGAELHRLRQIRERQGGLALDAVLGALKGSVGNDEPTGRARSERAVAETLASILYAVHLGEPGVEATSGNVALRHDFGISASATGIPSSMPWRLASEDFSSKAGWRLRGSLLGLETALGRLSLRRLDPSALPERPRLGGSDIQTLMLANGGAQPICDDRCRA